MPYMDPGILLFFGLIITVFVFIELKKTIKKLNEDIKKQGRIAPNHKFWLIVYGITLGIIVLAGLWIWTVEKWQANETAKREQTDKENTLRLEQDANQRQLDRDSRTFNHLINH